MNAIAVEFTKERKPRKAAALQKSAGRDCSWFSTARTLPPAWGLGRLLPGFQDHLAGVMRTSNMCSTKRNEVL
jgi:hypothetical protein